MPLRLLTTGSTGGLALASACPLNVALLSTSVTLRIPEAALGRVVTPSTTVARFTILVLSGSPWWLGYPMNWYIAVCTGLLEVPGISFCQFHGLGDLQGFVKCEIPFREEALLNLSLSKATHKSVT